MKYVGKLFGQIGRTRGYFDTGKTSKDWDALEARAERAEAELAVERKTSRLHLLAMRERETDHDATREQALTLANSLDQAQAELAAERARLDWVFHNCKVTADDYATGNREVYAVHDREDLGAAMKEGAK